jgi:hypothetical protein
MKLLTNFENPSFLIAAANDSKGKPNRNFMRLLEIFLKLVNVFKEASKDLILIFLWNKTG